MTVGDGRGSGGLVIDHDSGEVVERMAYQPYGNLDADYRPARWSYNYERHEFGGHWDNFEDGLVYMGARYYSPQLGRFMSPDPLWIHGLQGDPNPYEYAGGNPVRFGDPTGMDPCAYTSEIPMPDPGEDEAPPPDASGPVVFSTPNFAAIPDLSNAGAGGGGSGSGASRVRESMPPPSPPEDPQEMNFPPLPRRPRRAYRPRLPRTRARFA